MPLLERDEQLRAAAGYLAAGTRQWAGRTLELLDRLEDGPAAAEVRVHVLVSLGTVEILRAGPRRGPGGPARSATRPG